MATIVAKFDIQALYFKILIRRDLVVYISYEIKKMYKLIWKAIILLEENVYSYKNNLYCPDIMSVFYTNKEYFI